MTTARSIRDLFDRYEEMVAKQDGGAAAQLYADVFVASSPAGLMSGVNDESFADVINQGYGHYRSLGLESMTISGIDERWLGDDHCVATVHWHSTFTTTEPIDFEVTYLVRADGDELRIFGWVSHEDEAAVFRERGLTPG